MVKALLFKGDKKPKKRKRTVAERENPTHHDATSSLKQHQPAQNTEEIEDDDTWVSADAVTDIAGPTVLVLATEPPTCLACDSMGKVFASKIENLVDGRAATSEPHDVRQVWIANRVVGSEDRFTLKGHHGRYLGCDKYGLLFATKEAVSQEETFKVMPATGDTVGAGTETGSCLFEIQTMRNTFLTVDDEKSPPEPRGDAERIQPKTDGEGEKKNAEKEGNTGELEDSCKVRIRMQARFKPKHKVDKAEKIRAKISRKELEDEVGRRLEDDEVKRLKKARKEGTFHEAMLDVKVRGKHDKFA